ncbi:hypothetical protein WME75_15910 [Sorangium sp. So ce1014]|uniref:hypothetical protein n=1 Tax=Sorangium sp. So ce1014 TaxID=3133326 RepID=UPI003F5E871E
MSSPRENLGQVVAGGPAAWTQRNRQELAKALEESGQEAAIHLRSFCEQVETWLHERDNDRDSDDFGARRGWIERVADPFLSGMTAERLDVIVKQLTFLDAKIDLLRTLLHRPTQYKLLPAILSTGEQLASAAPRQPPLEGDTETPWLGQLRLLVTLTGLAGRTASNALELTSLLAPMPAWLLKGLFSSLGSLDLFEAYEFDLAIALAHLDVSVASAISADAWMESPHTRLAEVIQVLAELLAGPPRNIPSHRIAGKLPPKERIEEFLAAFRACLHTRDLDRAHRLWSLIESAQRYTEEMCSLFTAYLNARPSNHELVLDLLSSHGDPPHHSVAHWKLPTVSMSMFGSMRTSSIHTPLGDKHQFDPPDFDPACVLRGLDREAAAYLVLAQPSPEFALDYLRRFRLAENPCIDDVLRSVLAHPSFLARLRSASGTMAVAVLTGIEELHLTDNDEGRRLATSLLHVLLPRIPSQYLKNESISWLTEVLEKSDIYEAEIVRRLTGARSADEIHHLISTGSARNETIARILDSIDVTPLRPPEGNAEDALEAWATSMVHLCSEAPALVRRIVADLPLEVAARLVRSYKHFGLGEQEDVRWIAERLAFKVLVIERWAELDSGATIEYLRTNVQRDFWLWAWCGLRAADSLIAVVSKAGDAWLDMLARTEPELVDVYLAALLRLMKSSDDLSTGLLDLSHAIAYTSSWLERRGRMAGEALWDRLNRRIDEPESADSAEASGRADEIATIGSAALPGPPECLRALREHAVHALQQWYARPAPVKLTRPVQKFRELLRHEAPDLHAELLRQTMSAGSPSGEEM